MSIDSSSGEGTSVVDVDDDELTVQCTVSTVPKQVELPRPWLVVARGAGIGRMYRVDRTIVLGRSPQSDVCIDLESVSRQHAHIEVTRGGEVRILDLGSRNGTFVNGEPVVGERLLRDGDKIQIGTAAVFKLSYQDQLDEAMQQALYESVTRDPLTGAMNRRAFDEALAREHAFALRHRRALSLAAFDVDRFKRINDAHGHLAGELVLERLAKVVTTSVRREDALARLDGDEFAILLREASIQHAVQCAERLRCTVERTVFDMGAGCIPVTISLGVVELRAAVHPGPAALVEAADRALHEAKRAGRNCVCTTER